VILLLRTSQLGSVALCIVPLLHNLHRSRWHRCHNLAAKMSIICQDVAILTTTTIRTIMTVYVSTVLSQAVGRPRPSTSVVVGSSCSAYTSANSTTERCSTSSSTITMFLTASPSEVQIPMTITSQIYQTQFNTLMGSSCRTVPVQPTPPSPTPQPTPATPQPTPATPQPTTPATPQPTPPEPGLTDTTFTTEYVTVTGVSF